MRSLKGVLGLFYDAFGCSWHVLSCFWAVLRASLKHFVVLILCLNFFVFPHPLRLAPPAPPRAPLTTGFGGVFFKVLVV